MNMNTWIDCPEGADWYHRIDDVPALYSKVEVVTIKGERKVARVIPASAGDLREFAGIGADVTYDIYQPNGLAGGYEVLLASGIAWIRPITESA